MSTGRRHKAVGKLTIWWPSDAPVQDATAPVVETFARSAIEAGTCLFCSWRLEAARAALAEGRAAWALAPPTAAGAARPVGLCVEHGLALTAFLTPQARGRLCRAALGRLARGPRAALPEFRHRRRAGAPICALCPSESGRVGDKMAGAARWLETAAAEPLLRAHPALVCVAHADCVRARWSRRGGERLHGVQSATLFDWADGRDLAADPVAAASFLVGAALVVPTWSAVGAAGADAGGVEGWLVALLGGAVCPACATEGQVLDRFADALAAPGREREAVAAGRLGDLCRLHALALVTKLPAPAANRLLAAIAGRILTARGRGRARAPRADRPCPACQAVDEADARFWALVGTTWQARWQEALDAGEGVCARHLPAALSRLAAVSRRSAGCVQASARRRYAIAAWALDRWFEAQAGSGSWSPPPAQDRAVDEACRRLLGSTWQAASSPSKEDDRP